MKAWKFIRRIIFAIAFVWVTAFIADNACVMSSKPPIFCARTENNHYVGAGYSFDIYPHPITGEIQQAGYLFRITMYSTFTN